MEAIRNIRRQMGPPPQPTPPPGAPRPPTGPGASAIDVENGYLVFLGRPAESMQATAAKIGASVDALKADFLASSEFATFVAEPVLASDWLETFRFSQPVEPRLTQWVLGTLEPTSPARRRIEEAVTWPVLLAGLIEDQQARPSSGFALSPTWKPELLLNALNARDVELNAALLHIGGARGAQLKLADAIWVAPGMIRVKGRLRLIGDRPELEAVVEGRMFAAEWLDLTSEPGSVESAFSCLIHVDVDPGWSGPIKVGLRVAQGSTADGTMAVVPLTIDHGYGSADRLFESLKPALQADSSPALASTAARAATAALTNQRNLTASAAPNPATSAADVSIVIPIAHGAHRVRHLLSFIDRWAAGLDYEVIFAPTSPDLRPKVAAAVEFADVAGSVTTVSPCGDLPVGLAAYAGLTRASAETVVLMSEGYVPPRSPALRALTQEVAASNTIMAARGVMNFDGTRHTAEGTIASINRRLLNSFDLHALSCFHDLRLDLSPGLIAGRRSALLERLMHTPPLLTAEMFWLSILAFSTAVTASEILSAGDMTYIGAPKGFEDAGPLTLDRLILEQVAKDAVDESPYERLP